MATLEELQTQLERLQEIRAKGVSELEISTGSGGHRRLVYSSGKELEAAIASLQRQIATASGNKVNSVVFCTTKGI